ncbi:MAG: hypothetical protein V3S55_04785 [Nitrospiraceae bacterium]|jgi:hypothetical protein
MARICKSECVGLLGAVLFVPFAACQPRPVECDRARLEQAASLLSSEPLRAVELLEAQPGCDDRFALLYRADREIVSKCDESYYYHGKVNPRGWYDTAPNAFELYVITHVERFGSGGEGTPISVNNYWLRKIRNRRHEAIGDYELDGIRWFDDAVWEDGDGSAHTPDLIRRYREWLNAWPDHASAPAARARIEKLQE